MVEIDIVTVHTPNESIDFTDVDSFEEIEKISAVFSENFDDGDKVLMNVEVSGGEPEGLGELFS